MRYVQGNDIYLNMFRMLIGRSVPKAEVGVPEVLKKLMVRFAGILTDRASRFSAGMMCPKIDEIFNSSKRYGKKARTMEKYTCR
jgi:hypothetical protein